MNVLKKIFLSKEKQAICNLVELAYLRNEISDKEFEKLKQTFGFIDKPQTNRRPDAHLEIVDEPAEKFKIIYALEKPLIQNGEISVSRVSLMKRILSVFEIRTDRLLELIHYLKLNIVHGKSVDQAYDRLSYLLTPSKY